MNDLESLKKSLFCEDEDMVAHVYTFPVPATAEQPRKILEEAGELVNAYARWDISRAVMPTKRVSVNVEDELADVVMACCNMAAAEGIDLQKAMERCAERQMRRGRYEG